MTELSENDNVMIRRIQFRTFLLFTGLYLVFVGVSLLLWPRDFTEEVSAYYIWQIILAWFVVIDYPFNALRKTHRFKNTFDISPHVSSIDKSFPGRWDFPEVRDYSREGSVVHKLIWGLLSLHVVPWIGAIFCKPARDIFGQVLVADVIASALPAMVLAYVLPGYMCRIYIDRPDFTRPSRTKPRNIFKFIVAAILFPVIAYVQCLSFIILSGLDSQASIQDYWYVPFVVLSLSSVIPILVIRFARKESFDRSDFLHGYWTYMLAAMALGLAFIFIFWS
ncbi:MAG: hypothetical protein JEZ07_11885 [Phycisphaerae bacterium]|nr:hypothetical protein [Phycisphaerae bacterium]